MKLERKASNNRSKYYDKPKPHLDQMMIDGNILIVVEMSVAQNEVANQKVIVEILLVQRSGSCSR